MPVKSLTGKLTVKHLSEEERLPDPRSPSKVSQQSPTRLCLEVMKHPTLRRIPRTRHAFSLVEAVISIGIVSFAMMSMLGMIPVGLATFRTAMNLTVESTIVQEVAGDLQRTEYANLAATNLYFDDQGIRVTHAEHPSRTYSVEVCPPGPLDAATLVAPAAASTVAVKVQNRAAPSVTNRYSVIVPRSH